MSSSSKVGGLKFASPPGSAVPANPKNGSMLFFSQMAMLKLKLTSCSVVTDKRFTYGFIKLHNSLSARYSFDKETHSTDSIFLEEYPGGI